MESCLLWVVRADLQKHLRCLSRAADSIAVGDTIDAVIRRGQRWNMLPTQVLFPHFSCCDNDCKHFELVTRPHKCIQTNVCDSQSYSNFLSKLKTHYFNITFYNNIIC